MCCLLTVAQSETLRGDATAPSSDGTRQFQWQVTRCVHSLRSEWRNGDGVLVAWDQVGLGSLGLERYELARPSVQRQVLVIRRGAVLEIWSYGPQGEDVQRLTRTPGTSLLAGPMLVAYVKEQLPLLRGGAAMVVDYLIPERAMVIALRLQGRAITADGRSRIDVAPASAWLRPFVAAAELEFDGAGRFLRMQGRLLPQAGSVRHPLALEGELRTRSWSPTSSCNT